MSNQDQTMPGLALRKGARTVMSMIERVMEGLVHWLNVNRAQIWVWHGPDRPRAARSAT
jgi:hypothetical protein